MDRRRGQEGWKDGRMGRQNRVRVVGMIDMGGWGRGTSEGL